MSQRQFAAPVSPWAVSEDDLGKLRSAVREAETELRHAESRGAPAVDRMRLEQQLKSARRELDTAQHEIELERRKQRLGYQQRTAMQARKRQAAAQLATNDTDARRKLEAPAELVAFAANASKRASNSTVTDFMAKHLALLTPEQRRQFVPLFGG